MPDDDKKPETGTDPKPDPKKDDDDDGAGGKRAILAELAEERKARQRLEGELKKLQDRDKSEGEKLADRVADAERRAEEAERRALRLEVASVKGLTAAQAKRLAGSTKEELEADADELLETFRPAAPAAGNGSGGDRPAGGRPKESLKPGAVPDAEPAPDIRSIVDSLPRGI